MMEMHTDEARGSHGFRSSEICCRSHDIDVIVKLSRQTVTHGSHNGLRRDCMLVQVVFGSEHLFNLVDSHGSRDPISSIVVNGLHVMV
jgi:hypothetical protein